jgi:hypothetical protein
VRSYGSHFVLPTGVTKKLSRQDAKKAKEILFSSNLAAPSGHAWRLGASQFFSGLGFVA